MLDSLGSRASGDVTRNATSGKLGRVKYDGGRGPEEWFSREERTLQRRRRKIATEQSGRGGAQRSTESIQDHLGRVKRWVFRVRRCQRCQRCQEGV